MSWTRGTWNGLKLKMWQLINILGLIAAVVLVFIIPNLGGAVLIACAVSVGARIIVAERKRTRGNRTDV